MPFIVAEFTDDGTFIEVPRRATKGGVAGGGGKWQALS